MAIAPMQFANAQLASVGPVDPANGFPTSYTDAQGTQLDLCLANTGFCLLPAAVELLNPAQPFPVNYGGTFPDEAFYWAGSADVVTNGGGQGLLIMALEAAFVNGPVVPGDQVTFGRMRIRLDNLVLGATYHITTPYGTFDEVATRTGRRSINVTRDIGLIPGDFVTALASGIGPFLRWDSQVPIVDFLGNQYLGDPNTPHTVTGSPTGNNVFRVDGPSVGGPGVNTISTNLFSIMGKIGVPPPVAGFSAAPLAGTAPLLVAFTDASTGSITSRSWNFGDGSTSTVLAPTHTYTTPGLYTVSLTVTGPGGTNTATRAGLINVTAAAAAPVAAFSATPLSGTAPLNVAFTDASTGTVTGWAWSFGDGTTSTLQSPSHTYTAAGLYTVSLTVTGPGGTNTATNVGMINVGATPPPPPPPAAFTLSAPAPGVAGQLNTFTITGCTPGATISLLQSTLTGTSFVTIGGVRFRTGLNRPTVVGSAVATGTEVTITINVARANAGRNLRFQAWDGGARVTSNVVTDRF